MYLLICRIKVMGLQIPQQLLQLFLVLIGHEDPLQGHGAHLRPDGITGLWERSGPRQGPRESFAAAFPMVSAIPVSISTSPPSTSIPATCTPEAAAAAATASCFARSGGKAR